MFRRVSELVLWPNCPTRAFRDLPGAVNVDVREDIAYELACLQQAGVAHPICVDLSRPPFDLSVVRILVPGLQTWDLDRLGWRGLRYLLEPASLFAKLS
jgi:ribosomal protein S12 methylthiotransferase accessory factor YcaO